MSFENRSYESPPEPSPERRPPAGAARIAPVPARSKADVDAELERWMPPGSPIEPLGLFRTLVRNLPLAQAMRPLGSHLLSRRSTIPLRAREIAIDRVCARLGCEYEWGVHAAIFGASAGLDDDALRATVRGKRDDPAWSAEDALIVGLVDSLIDTHGVPDDLWSVLAERFSDEQLLALVVLVGWYHAIAFVLNAVRVEREEWAVRFPINR